MALDAESLYKDHKVESLSRRSELKDESSPPNSPSKNDPDVIIAMEEIASVHRESDTTADYRLYKRRFAGLIGLVGFGRL